MPDQELVTIVLTTLNSERFVVRSIDSCLGQTYRNLELLVVDGGSQDRTLGILSGYDDPRIRVIHQRENAGKLPGALNLGMSNAQGDFITWTQDDSWYEPNAVETMIGYLGAHPEVALVYADYWFVNEAGKRIHRQVAPPPEQISTGGDVVGQCFLFRREVYEAIGPQDPQHFPVHEIPWRVRIAARFRIQPLNQPLLYYTVHSNSLTGKIGAWQLQYLSAEALFQEGHWDERTYRRRLARIHIDQAYDEFILQGNYPAFWRHVCSGIRGDRTWIGNRGLWKLVGISLLPIRKRYRVNLLAQWKTDQEAILQRYVQEQSEGPPCPK